MDPPNLPKFPCDLCGFKTAYKSRLRDHINGVHLGVKPHKCDICNFATAHYDSLASHKKRPHLKCEQCPFIAVGKGGTVRQEMRMHEQRHHGISRSESPIIDSCCLVSGTDIVASNDDLITIEEKTFIGSDAQSLSMEVEQCDDSKNLPLKETTFAKDMRFPCDLCGYIADRKERLVDHVNGVHLKVKPFKCDTCNFATTHKKSLAYHKMKPHLTCELCPFITVGSSQMKFHMRRHHDNSKGEETQTENTEEVSSDSTTTRKECSVEIAASNVDAEKGLGATLTEDSVNSSLKEPVKANVKSPVKSSGIAHTNATCFWTFICSPFFGTFPLIFPFQACFSFYCIFTIFSTNVTSFGTFFCCPFF